MSEFLHGCLFDCNKGLRRGAGGLADHDFCDGTLFICWEFFRKRFVIGHKLRNFASFKSFFMPDNLSSLLFLVTLNIEPGVGAVKVPYGTVNPGHISLFRFINLPIDDDHGKR